MKYDVIIIGAGPAGLKAAEILAKNKKSVLVLEKNKGIGRKVCAGGITEHDLEYIPKGLASRKFDYFFMSLENKSKIKVNYRLYTIERESLGKYQYNLAKKAGAEVKTDCFVSEIRKNSVIADGKEYFFNYLIGADGSNSIVKKYLKLKSKIICLAIQYKIKKQAKDIEMIYNPKKYGLWYVWSFPHKNCTRIGIADSLNSGKISLLRKKLDCFIKNNSINLKEAEFEACLTNADYQGYKFGNIFLAGDAAGLANPFTGEGIYSALLSGEEIAKKIINPACNCERLRGIILKHKKITLLFSILCSFRILFKFSYWLGFKLLKYKYFQKLFTRKFFY
jgi:geranylgeranyl reductase